MILTELLEWLSAQGFSGVLDHECAAYLGREKEGVERADMAAHEPAIALSLGGDGTLLSVLVLAPLALVAAGALVFLVGKMRRL